MVALILVTIDCSALGILGSSDPNANLAPATGYGAESQGFYEGCTATVIGDSTIISVPHIGGGIGSIFTLGGTNYTVTNFVDSPSGNFRLSYVDKKFPRNTIASLYTGSDEVGKEVRVYGRGPVRGPTTITSQSSLPLSISNFVYAGGSNSFDVSSEIEGTFQVQCSSNYVNWMTMPDIYSVDPANGSTRVTVFCSNACSLFRTVATSTTITNGFDHAASDGNVHYAINKVSGIQNNVQLLISFDVDGGYYESVNWFGDSSGGMFILDAGKWKLAGLMESIDGSYTIRTQDGTVMYASVCDRRGLSIGYYDEFLGYFEIYSIPACSSTPAPTSSQYMRISVDANWINKHIK